MCGRAHGATSCWTRAGDGGATKRPGEFIAGPSLWTDGPLGRSVAERVEFPVQACASHAERRLVADRERVAGGGGEGRPGISGRRAVTPEVDIQVLALDADILRHGVFGATADRVADARIGAR